MRLFPDSPFYTPRQNVFDNGGGQLWIVALRFARFGNYGLNVLTAVKYFMTEQILQCFPTMN